MIMFNIDKDLQFTVLCPEFKFGGVRTTVSSIRSNFNNPEVICSIPDTGTNEESRMVANICPIVKGGATISSMINAGLRKGTRDWNLVLVAGNVIKYNPLLKYVFFTKSEKDVLYRVVDKVRWRWEDASIHGLLMHRKAIGEVGDFPDEESIKSCKTLWGARAAKNGYTFKGLVGVKIV